MALTGDFVGVDDGTIFGTAYNLTDKANTGTQANNVLVKVDLTNGAVTSSKVADHSLLAKDFRTGQRHYAAPTA